MSSERSRYRGVYVLLGVTGGLLVAVVVGCCLLGAWAAMYDWNDPDPKPMLLAVGSLAAFGAIAAFAGIAFLRIGDS